MEVVLLWLFQNNLCKLFEAVSAKSEQKVEVKDLLGVEPRRKQNMAKCKAFGEHAKWQREPFYRL